MKRLQIALCVVMLTLMSAKAQNPVVQTCYTGDPALMASGDRMYLYVGHDEDKADFFWMYEWRCYSSSDMVNWTDHGSPLNLSAFEWADDRAWASQTIEGFRAPNFKERDKSTKYEDCYTEGPWIMKRNVYPVNKKGKTAKKPVWLYYLLYAAGGIPEHISYSTAPTPEGPWAYRGNIMPLEETKSFTNHCGVADFKGHSYFVYHTGKLPGGWEEWRTLKTNISPYITGKHDVYFVFTGNKGPKLFNFDWWKME